ncbi:MAG: hypothetical protein BWX61_01337 [Bacteroidetes bacterium ADurb.Bin035]|nr:MAG: hypothetical protein BWX61_01337 [Bacteroidetes bacterium ADurb.Bin035]
MYAPNISIFQVPNVYLVSFDNFRANIYEINEILRAEACVPICNPSEKSAIEPNIHPAIISASIVINVITTTISVLRSADFFSILKL